MQFSSAGTIKDLDTGEVYPVLYAGGLDFSGEHHIKIDTATVWEKENKIVGYTPTHLYKLVVPEHECYVRVGRGSSGFWIAEEADNLDVVEKLAEIQDLSA